MVISSLDMALQLPDPPESLHFARRRFYDELRRMLDVVRPSKVDPERTSVKFDGSSVEVELVHCEREGWSISATVGERDAIVATWVLVMILLRIVAVGILCWVIAAAVSDGGWWYLLLIPLVPVALVQLVLSCGLLWAWGRELRSAEGHS